MNALERLLQEDLHHLVDAIAAGAPPGIVPGAACCRPSLPPNLADAEARLTALRSMLLEGYAQWRRALGECRDLWAVAALEVEPAVESAAGDRWAA